jgi:hypothetical protein
VLVVGAHLAVVCGLNTLRTLRVGAMKRDVATVASVASPAAAGVPSPAA